MGMSMRGTAHEELITQAEKRNTMEDVSSISLYLYRLPVGSYRSHKIRNPASQTASKSTDIF
jgi:hypothetical protein